MAAGIILGSLVLPIEGSSPRNERNGKAKHLEMAAAAISRAKREHPPHPHLQLNIDGRRRGTNSSSPSSSSSSSSSKIGAAASSSSSSGGGGDGGGGGDWEENLKKRLKDLEEMRELEKRAEELQSQLAAEGEEREETEEEKRERVRRELEKVAKEQAERRETAKLMFELGKKAYGKGMYARAIEFLEAALTIIPRPTLFGGEIQIWLAMAYEANNRHKDCIDLYRQLEKKHPVVSIRRQAAELRYILQAPKLKISKDEMVTIPLIGSSYDSYAGSWSDKYKDRGQRRKMVTTNQLPSSRDFFGDFIVFRPPSGWEENRYLWLFLAMWLSLIGTALLMQR